MSSANGRLIGKDLIGLNVVRPSNAYVLETLGGGEEFGRSINGKYLKKYYPSVWINTLQPISSIIGSNSQYH